MDGCNPTGVFFPQRFGFKGDIDVILYFHGWKDGEYLNVKTIDYYWSGRFQDIKLREDVNASGKSVVLIAPMLGDKPGSVQTADMGVFRSPGGGDDFLEEVKKWIGKYVPQYKGKAPNVRNVVLAGHSGGGVILDIQARSMKANVLRSLGVRFDVRTTESIPSRRRPGLAGRCEVKAQDQVLLLVDLRN